MCNYRLEEVRGIKKILTVTTCAYLISLIRNSFRIPISLFLLFKYFHIPIVNINKIMIELVKNITFV
jgi:hypothetical protein